MVSERRKHPDIYVVEAGKNTVINAVERTRQRSGIKEIDVKFTEEFPGLFRISFIYPKQADEAIRKLWSFLIYIGPDKKSFFVNMQRRQPRNGG